MHELLGNHKPSAEWYTPDDIWQRVLCTLGVHKAEIFDPCPITSLEDGLNRDWLDTYQRVFFKSPNIYVNPPTPAAPWAIKAIQTHLEHPEVNIIFACFSEAVLWQVNTLMDFPVCWVRNRIRWIHGNQWIKAKKGEQACDYAKYEIRDGELYISNPNYLKPAKSPRNYNAFVCLSVDNSVRQRFVDNFQDLGTVRLSHAL